MSKKKKKSFKKKEFGLREKKKGDLKNCFRHFPFQNPASPSRLLLWQTEPLCSFYPRHSAITALKPEVEISKCTLVLKGSCQAVRSTCPGGSPSCWSSLCLLRCLSCLETFLVTSWVWENAFVPLCTHTSYSVGGSFGIIYKCASI